MAKLILGIDPAQLNTGYAFRIDNCDVVVGSIKGIENIGDVRDALSVLLAEWPNLELWAVIECPNWSGNGTKETRSAAIAWQRVLQQTFKKRRIFFVDPRQWQSLMLHGVPGQGTKERSIWRAKMAGFNPKNDHEADAINLMMYAELRSNEMITTGDERGNAAKLRKERKR